MNLLSSSSTTNNYFNKNFYNSKYSTTRCLARVLRRVFCSRSLPTYPSDQITEVANSYNSAEFKKLQTLKDMEENQKTEASLTPGVVARLMGLESIPEYKLGSHQTTQNSISRSRSLNSVDNFEGCDKRKGIYRRVKSTLSSREIPTFVQLEDDEFFILSFENESKSDKLRSKGKNCELGCGELKQRRSKRRSKDTENRVVKEEDQEAKRTVLKDLNGRQTLKGSDSNDNSKVSNVSSIATKSFQKRQHFEAEEVKSLKPRAQEQISNRKMNCDLVKRVEYEYCSSEDSSPVSVLDCGRLLIDQKFPISEVDYNSNSSKSRRKLSHEIEIVQQLCSSSKEDNLVGDEGKKNKNEDKYSGLRQQEIQIPENLVMCDDICKLSEAEVIKSSWLPKKLGFEGIGVDLESEIIGELLQELIDQLAGLT